MTTPTDNELSAAVARGEVVDDYELNERVAKSQGWYYDSVGWRMDFPDGTYTMNRPLPEPPNFANDPALWTSLIHKHDIMLARHLDGRWWVEANGARAQSSESLARAICLAVLAVREGR